MTWGNAPEWAQLFESYRLNSDPDRDIRPLTRSVAERFRAGSMPIAEVGPALGVVWHQTFDFDSGLFQRVMVRVAVWFARTIALRGRPLWNDFHMALWQLSRDPYYVQILHEHLKHANASQLVSAEWMVNSVCEQDPEFAGHWRQAVELMGTVFAGLPRVSPGGAA